MFQLFSHLWKPQSQKDYFYIYEYIYLLLLSLFNVFKALDFKYVHVAYVCFLFISTENLSISLVSLITDLFCGMFRLISTVLVYIFYLPWFSFDSSVLRYYCLLFEASLSCLMALYFHGSLLSPFAYCLAPLYLFHLQP